MLLSNPVGFGVYAIVPTRPKLFMRKELGKAVVLLGQSGGLIEGFFPRQHRLPKLHEVAVAIPRDYRAPERARRTRRFVLGRSVTKRLNPTQTKSIAITICTWAGQAPAELKGISKEE